MVEKIDQETKVDTQTVTYFQINIDGIVDGCENIEIKEKLEKLSDQFRFSDPVSSEVTKEIEEKINHMLSELKSHIEDKHVDEANTLIQKISNTMKERNRICKAKKVKS